MTPEQLKSTPAAAVSTVPDTEIICQWLKEMVAQQMRMNDLLERIARRRMSREDGEFLSWDLERVR